MTYLRCGNRRRAVCPSCSHQYQGDVFHLIMAGAAGGMKDVPAEVVTHPLVFATVTAPSFGPVHAAKKPGRRGGRRCRPRSGDARQLCPHGRPSWCMAVHQHTDTVVGQPLCVDCYDYHGHLVWQWYAPELWRRFTIGLRRQLARHLGVTETDVPKPGPGPVREGGRVPTPRCRPLPRPDPARRPTHRRPAVSAAHGGARGVGAGRSGGPGRPVRCRVTRTPVDGTDRVRRLRFGRQVDVRVVHDQADRDDPAGAALHPETVAAYVAKYATKAAADLGSGDAAGSAHLRRLRTVVGELAVRASLAGQTGPEGAFKGWSRWADMLGFRGHFASKSRRYSTTLGRLRQARRDHVRRQIRERSSGRRNGPTTTRTTTSWSPPRWWSGRGGSPGSAGSPPETPRWPPRPLPGPATTDPTARGLRRDADW